MPGASDLVRIAAETEDPRLRARYLDAAERASLREAILGCTRCPLHEDAKAPVPWRGGPSPLVVVGEAPGRQEDSEGKPFVGPAGRLLDDVLSAVGLPKVTYINTICCRPPENRYGVAEEVGGVKACHDWFQQQLTLSRAWIIVPVGNNARAKFPRFLGDDAGITSMRGHAYWWGRWLVYPTFHPAYVLRNNNIRETFAKDFQKVADLVNKQTEAKASLPNAYAADVLLSSLRKVEYGEPERQRLQRHFQSKGWVQAYSHWLEDHVILVKDEKVRVPGGVEGVVYHLQELVRMSHMERNWGDAVKIHNAKKVLGGTLF
jgi:DNA polymerase